MNEVIKVDVVHKVTALQLGGAGQPEPQHAPQPGESSHLKKCEHMKVLRVYCGYNVIDNGFTGRGGKKEITSGR